MTSININNSFEEDLDYICFKLEQKEGELIGSAPCDCPKCYAESIYAQFESKDFESEEEENNEEDFMSDEESQTIFPMEVENYIETRTYNRDYRFDCALLYPNRPNFFGSLWCYCRARPELGISIEIEDGTFICLTEIMWEVDAIQCECPTRTIRYINHETVINSHRSYKGLIIGIECQNNCYQDIHFPDISTIELDY